MACKHTSSPRKAQKSIQDWWTLHTGQKHFDIQTIQAMFDVLVINLINDVKKRFFLTRIHRLFFSLRWFSWSVTGIYFSCVSQTKLSLPLSTPDAPPPFIYSGFSLRTHPCGHSHTCMCVIKSALTSAFADFDFSFPPIKHTLRTCLCLCLPLLTSVCHGDGIYHL